MVQVKCDVCGKPATLMFEASANAHEHAQYARACPDHVEQTVAWLSDPTHPELKFIEVGAKEGTHWQPWPKP
ncbi:MAG: hypothetical protein A3D44_01635 [Candidatus Staskawiczbacteria bacterium RIFCSPHIGHO2_02_FULL_42_22]|uniref:Uncharacterized protein n=1 Tax=Candidatus Staskawiczbacteria bacterium RIFCSPHIGHO2_02_FULL_42_22 TaxID=1802207 RepID=A0A1G2I1Q1_9BACT|nr:MAG: hypothetical protein A3D44_01635 [Candidatus Staskawiczbacteria bacterium RIFCSPHIGHO2_02_FULL_42_22]